MVLWSAARRAAFERSAIPGTKVGRGLVCGLQEFEQGGIGCGRAASHLIRQHELPQGRIEAGPRWTDRML